MSLSKIFENEQRFINDDNHINFLIFDKIFRAHIKNVQLFTNMNNVQITNFFFTNLRKVMTEYEYTIHVFDKKFIYWYHQLNFQNS